ncbi:MAG: hypothetical protein FD167_2027 [bacterium]|nr:MAG: hypothetical protein FD167_2027 [bacterium]
MSKYFILIFVVFGLLVMLGVAKEKMSSPLPIDNQQTKFDDKQQHTKSVLVELFTSEGCSSCPPADKVLEELSTEQPIANTDIIVLSEHVDYWNRLGWQDPYSLNEFSLRQDTYAQVFGNTSVYTPQMVINGQHELVGSDKQKALGLIGKSVDPSTFDIKLSYKENTKSSLEIAIDISKLPLASNKETNNTNDINDVMLAIAEDKLQSSVIRGENAGRKLHHIGVVRKLSSVGEITPSKTASPKYNSRVEIALLDKWQRSNLKIVVFVQNRKTRQVFGVTSIKI